MRFRRWAACHLLVPNEYPRVKPNARTLYCKRVLNRALFKIVCTTWRLSCYRFEAATSPRSYVQRCYVIQRNPREGQRSHFRRFGQRTVQRHLQLAVANNGCTRTQSCGHRVRQIRDPDLVLEPVSARIRSLTEVVPVRVLLEIHEEQSGSGAASGQVHVAPSAGHGNLPM